MRELNHEKTIDELFKRAIKIERKAGDIYKELSNLFSHIPEVSALWKGLAEDETLHMNTLQDIHKSLTQEQLSSPSDEQIWENVVKIQYLLDKDLLGQIKNLDDAYELAHELEFSEVNAIFKFLTIDLVPSEERKEFVMSEIKQHQQKLLDFDHNFGDRTWRRQINIQDT